MYEHVQRNFGIFAAVLVFGALPQFVIVALQPKGVDDTMRIVFFGTALLALVIGAIFCTLTIRVDDRTLRWQFGPGAMRKTIALSDIASIEPTKTNWYDGLGVHLTTRGWLYNIGGKRAVFITLKNGKHFLLGTDEPAALVERIRQHLGITHRVT